MFSAKASLGWEISRGFAIFAAEKIRVVYRKREFGNCKVEEN